MRKKQGVRFHRIRDVKQYYFNSIPPTSQSCCIARYIYIYIYIVIAMYIYIYTYIHTHLFIDTDMTRPPRKREDSEDAARLGAGTGIH